MNTLVNVGEIRRTLEELCRFFENFVILLNRSRFFLLNFETGALYCWIKLTWEPKDIKGLLRSRYILLKLNTVPNMLIYFITRAMAI